VQPTGRHRLRHKFAGGYLLTRVCPFVNRITPTSDRTNLTKGCIAAARMDGLIVFARFRQFAHHLPVIHSSLVQSTTKTASRSIQPFCTAHGIASLCSTVGRPSPSKLPIRMRGCRPPTNTWFLGSDVCWVFLAQRRQLPYSSVRIRNRIRESSKSSFDVDSLAKPEVASVYKRKRIAMSSLPTTPTNPDHSICQ